MATKPGTVSPENVDNMSTMLISTVTVHTGADPDPVRSAIEKFAEIDLQAARAFGGAPNKQLMEMAASKKPLTLDDMFKAGDLMAKDIQHKAPTTDAAVDFMSLAQTAIIPPQQPAAPASKFVTGAQDGYALAQQGIAATKYAAGFIQGINENITDHVTGYATQLTSYLSDTWHKPGGGWQILHDAEQKVESVVKPVAKAQGPKGP